MTLEILCQLPSDSRICMWSLRRRPRWMGRGLGGWVDGWMAGGDGGMGGRWIER